MSREPTINPRYELLLNAESVETHSDSTDDQDRPPLYREAAEQLPINGVAVPQGLKSTGPGSVLPSYEAATTLPSYKDVELEKEDEQRLEDLEEMFHLSSMRPEPGEPQIDGMAIGSDCVFIFVFLLCFFFNLIGFLIGYFVMNSFAARYGALTGFAASMFKWLMYIKYSYCCNEHVVKENVDYVFWILNALAFVMLLRGLVGWLSVRRFRNTPPDDCPLDETAPRPRYTMFQ